MIDFHTAQRLALVLSARLGDALVMMSLAHGLVRAGRDVTVFSTQVHRLARWFPGFDIRPVPDPAQAGAVLGAYDATIQMHADRPLNRPCAQEGRFSCFDLWRAQAHARLRECGRPPLVGELGVYARDVLGVTEWDGRNGAVAPSSLRHRHYGNRVIIHPTAGDPAGYWLRSHYAALARRLVRRGFDPQFVVEARERASWLGGEQGHRFVFVDVPSLAALADYLHESGWFIGSDSGIGHLASTCGIPTVTISERLRNMRRWTPAWAPSEVARPLWLPTKALRRRFWRQATTTGSVVRAFDRLRARAPITPR